MNRKARRSLKVVLEKGLDKTMAQRPCGECTACCAALAVEELGKPVGVPCMYVTEQGCGIYESRPKSCREYQCGWRFGYGSLEQRPDRVGVVLSPTAPSHPGHPAMLAHEVWPDAFADARELLADVAARLVVFLVRDGLPKSILGPEDRIRGMSGYIEEIRRLNAEARSRKST